MIDIQALGKECRKLAEKGARWNLGELQDFAHNLRMWSWYDGKQYKEQCERLIETLKTRTNK